MGSKPVAGLVGFLLTALSLYPVTGMAAADPYQLNLHQPQSSIASQIYDQHTLVMIISVIMFFGVCGVMFYSMLKHRKSQNHQAAHFHENTTIEIVWTIIPVLLLAVMGYPAAKTVIAMKDTSNPDITVKITGYQWKWGYEYLKGEGEGVSFYSSLATPLAQIENREPKGENYLLEVDNPMVVPVGKKIRLLITANDVIHAWWVPQVGVKQDAIPGFIRDSWFMADKPGTYRGQCTELCGKDHGFMPIVLEVMEPAQYAEWVAKQKAKSSAQAIDPNKVFTQEELMAQGEKVYAGTCAACHQANGQGIPGTFPSVDGSKITAGPKADHISLVLNGRPNTAMAAFKQLSDVEVAAVVTYQRNAWTSKTGDAVQPSEVKEFRK